MLLLSQILAFALLAQIPFYGDIPENVPTFTITFADGSTAHGALLINNQWYMEDVVDLPQGTYPTIVFDTPWAPSQDKQLRAPEFTREVLSLRKQRLSEQWKAMGFSPTPGSNGMVYAPTEEITLSARAKDMEAQVLAEVEGAVAPAPTPPQQAAPPPNGFRAYAQQWGLHALVAVLGMGVSALVFKKMVLDA